MNRAAYSGITRPNVSSPENGMLFGPSLEAQRGMTSVGATDAHLAAEFTPISVRVTTGG